MHYNINDSAESAQKTKKYKRGIFMKIKRIIAGILVAATCGLAMAGCQSNTTGGKLIMATEPGFANIIVSSVWSLRFSQWTLTVRF